MNKGIQKVLRNRKFVYLWSSQLLSQVSVHLMLFFVLVRTFTATQSTIATSFVWVVYALPALLIGPFAAAAVDVFDKRKILITSNFLQSLVLLSYAVFFERSIYISYWVVFFYSFFNQFYVPAEAASLPQLVRKKDLPAANSVFFITQQMALMIGFGGGGILTQIIGARASFFVMSVLLFIAYLYVTALPSMKGAVSANFEKGLGDFFIKIHEGYIFLDKNRILIIPFLLMLSLQAALTILGTMLPIITTNIVRIPASYSGLLVALPAGIGAGIGTVFITRMLSAQRKRNVIDMGFIILFLALLGSGFILPYIREELTRILLALLLFIFVGFGYVGVLIPSQTFLQETTPRKMRGRIFGTFWLFTALIAIIPVVFSATIVEIFGIQTMLAILALVAISALGLSRTKFKNFTLNKNEV